MLKDKEDYLVERALERINRARALGKTNVKLSRAEIDALERAEQRLRSDPTPTYLPTKTSPKSKKPVPSRSRALTQRKGSKGEKSASNSPKPKAIEPAKRSRSRTSSREDALVPYPILAEDQYARYGGPPPEDRHRMISATYGSRTGSSSSLRQSTHAPQPLPYHQHPYIQGRYRSNPDDLHQSRPHSNSSRVSRPDPSDPDWEPRARSTSSLVSFPIDQLPNPMQASRAPRFDPNAPRFAPQTRRIFSDPAPSQALHRRPSDEGAPRSSDVDGSPGQSSQDRTTSEDEDDDADDGQGMQIEITEESDGDYVPTRSQARKGNGRGRGGTQAKRRGR